MMYFVFLCIFFNSLFSGTVYETSILDKHINPMIEAIKKNDLRGVYDALQHEDREAQDDEFFAACYKGNKDIVQLFLDHGAFVNQMDENGNTPLMYAVLGTEKNNIVEFLIDNGAKVNIMNNQDRSPLMLAALNNHAHSVKSLIRAGASLTLVGGSIKGNALHHAVDNGSLKAAKILLHYKSPVNEYDATGMTPLMIAAFHNDVAMISLLQSYGADKSMVTEHAIPISLKKDLFDFHPKTEYIPQGATAFAIAQQFDKKAAQLVLED